jgi:hypothetical protein
MFGKLIPIFYLLNELTGKFEFDSSCSAFAYGEKGHVEYLSEDEFNRYAQSRIA